MLKKQYLIAQILKITFVIMAVSLLSCKTQKQNVKPAIDDTKSNEQMEVPRQEEDKPKLVTPDLLEEQKVNDFAEKKSGLLCALNQLKSELENTNDESQKIEINEQINQLKSQIAVLDKEIENAFQNIERINDVNRLAESLSRDC